jgi:integrase
MATTRALEDAEIFAMFENIRGKYAVRNRTMLTLGIHMALRATELCGLTVGDVYDGVDIRTYVEIRPETAKFKKARKVRISSAIRSALRDFIEWKGQSGEPIALESPLFISERGDHLSRKMLFVIVKLVLKNVSINESPHCLRKTGATIYYIESDYDLLATQHFLGHGDPSTTRDYIGLTSQQMAEYCERSGNRLLKAMREGAMVRLDTCGEMSNRDKNSIDDIQKLREELKQKDQIIDHLTRMLANQADSSPVNDDKIIPIHTARRTSRR